MVVGATSGIGQGLALRLARAGCGVTVVGRSQERGEAVVEELRRVAAESAESRGASSDAADYSFRQLDAFSLPACRALANGIAEAPDARLDYLVLTQGMATMQGYTPTPAEKGGLDEKLTLHYYSRALLMSSLAPLLQKSEGRCLTVLSGGVHSAYTGYKEDPDLSKGYSLVNAANCAGFYNDIAVEQLSMEFPGVSFMHASPGFVATSWGSEMPSALRALVRLLQNFGRSKEDAGEYLFRSLYHDEFKGGGFYIVDQYGINIQKLTDLHEQAKDAVWTHTTEVLSRF